MKKSINEHPYNFDGDRGPYMNTFSGISFYFLTPRPEDILIEDIAHHLAFQSRSTGAVIRDYSVAQHSLLVCDLVIEEITRQDFKNQNISAGWAVSYIAMQALLHDAEEFVTGDINKPLKSLLAPILDPIAKGIKKVIGIKLGYDLINMPPMIKHADNVAMATEKEQLYLPSDVIWHKLPEPDTNIIPTMTSLEAEAAFLKRFHRLASTV